MIYPHLSDITWGVCRKGVICATVFSKQVASYATGLHRVDLRGWYGQRDAGHPVYHDMEHPLGR